MIEIAFDWRFVEPIAEGRKTQTIRRHPHLLSHARRGDPLRLFSTDPETGRKVLIADAMTRLVRRAIINTNCIQIAFAGTQNRIVLRDGQAVARRFAERDGSASLPELIASMIDRYGQPPISIVYAVWELDKVFIQPAERLTPQW